MSAMRKVWRMLLEFVGAARFFSSLFDVARSVVRSCNCLRHGQKVAVD